MHLFHTVTMQGGLRPGWFVRLATHFGSEGIWNWELLSWVTLLVALVVTTVSFYKLGQLSRGGIVVARLLDLFEYMLQRMIVSAFLPP